MRAYADSSFIVALYLQQQSSARAIAFMESYRKELPFTAWHRLEVRNAVRLAVFHGAINTLQARTQLKQIDADLKEEVLIRHTIIDWTDVLREAEKLGAAHNEIIGCRSADVFHVAAARKIGCETFLTLDEKQRAMARAAGLSAKP